MIKKKSSNVVLYVAIALIFLGGLLTGISIGIFFGKEKVALVREEHREVIKDKDLQIDVLLVSLTERERVLDQIIIGLGSV